jgi:ABC-type spermidine/putrescine transport system permease subunit II
MAGRILLAGLAGLILLYLILPMLVVIPLSFSGQNFLSFPPKSWSLKWYGAMADNPLWLEATLNSLLIGIPTALISVALGTAAALGIIRGNIPRAGLISAAMVAPMMMPHVILAIGLYPVMLELGLLRSHFAAIIGHSVIGIPLVFITVSAAVTGYSGALELAAMTMGANPWQVFWKVTFPMIRVGMLIGGILAFATSFDELMLSLFLTGAATRTLPRLIWEQLSDFLTPTIAAVATLVFAFTLILLAVVSLLQLRRGRVLAGQHG